MLGAGLPALSAVIRITAGRNPFASVLVDGNASRLPALRVAQFVDPPLNLAVTYDDHATFASAAVLCSPLLRQRLHLCCPRLIVRTHIMFRTVALSSYLVRTIIRTMKPKPKRRGAPPKENPASERFEIRCALDQKERWQAAAVKSGFSSLASWLKSLADKSA